MFESLYLLDEIYFKSNKRMNTKHIKNDLIHNDFRVCFLLDIKETISSNETAAGMSFLQVVALVKARDPFLSCYGSTLPTWKSIVYEINQQGGCAVFKGLQQPFQINGFFYSHDNVSIPFPLSIFYK
jgi:hypothetical protein